MSPGSSESSDAPQLSVVIPAYNEAGRLPATLERIASYLRAEVRAFEILVVDDGSADDTAERARACLAGEPGGRVLSLPENRGKGAACRRGVLAARGDRILICDADLSTPIEEERRLRAPLCAGADVVIGSRAHPEARIEVRQARLREAAGRGLNRIMRWLGLTQFRDTQCGFKLFRREAAHTLFAESRIDGFLFDLEILMLAKRRDLAIVEVPVEWHNDPDSRVRVLRGLPSIAWQLLRILLRFLRIR